MTEIIPVYILTIQSKRHKFRTPRHPLNAALFIPLGRSTPIFEQNMPIPKHYSNRRNLKTPVLRFSGNAKH